MASLASSAQGSKEVPPFKPIAAEKRAQLEALRTSDPGELRRRWGPFVDLAGKVWVSTRSAAGGFEVQWVIEGALAQLTEFGCGRSPCFQRTGLLAYVVEPPFGFVDTSFEIDWSDRGAQRGFRSGDALHVSYGGFNGARYKFDAQTGLGFFGGYDYRVATDQDLHALAALGVELESQKAERQRVAAETQRKAAEARAQADADRAAAARAAEEARLLAVQATEESRRRAAEEAALRRRLEEEQQARALSDAEAKRKAAAQRPAPDDTQPAAAAARTGTDSAPAATKPLRFVLYISMRNLPGDTHNSNCYSNIITRPGPPGWGAGGFQASGSASQANAVINGLKAQFIAKCRSASGREITSEGNFGSVWNQHPADEARVDSTRPRFREDVSVSL